MYSSDFFEVYNYMYAGLAQMNRTVRCLQLDSTAIHLGPTSELKIT